MNSVIQQLKDANAEQNTAKILNLLPELFKAEEDGLIIEVPCKVGDTVWKIEKQEINQYLVRAMSIDADFHVVIRNFETESYGIIGYNDDVGKTVFLTREAAEKVLKERES